MTCPQIEELETYLSGELPADGRASLDLHLAGCVSCRSLLSEIEANTKTLEAVRSACICAETELDSRSPLPAIPGYEILRTIHAGGQGIVYEALQASTKRRVAVKLLLHGRYADKRARHRFEREIDLAASLDHPGIVAVFDSGTTDDGRLYLVMRYVEGAPLDPARVARELDVRAALSLFRKIAAAVAYAHQRGVIHRDLKPSNILIDTDGEPHLLDFGLAKTAKVPEAQQSLHTQAGEFVGTLAYAAPEQVSGAPAAVDVRSDVYALGVLLYEMLIGRHPYPVHGHLASIVRSITDMEAPRLSTQRRGIDDELDTIVLKALSKEMARRYQSVGDLVRDLERYAAGRPIEAKGDSAWYLLRKLLLRHRAPVAATGLIFLALLAATIVSLWFWRAAEADRARALIAEAEARQRADDLEAVTAFQASQLADIDSQQMGAGIRTKIVEKHRAALLATGTATLDIERSLHQLEQALANINFTNIALETLDENIFERALLAIDEQIVDQPLIRAGLLHTLGETLRTAGLLDRAVSPQTEALTLRRQILGDDHADTLRSMAAMGVLLLHQGRLSEAEAYYDEALAGRRRVLGESHPDTLGSLNDMGLLLWHQGRLSEAETYYRYALEGRRIVLGSEHQETLTSLSNMGLLLRSKGRFEEAETYYSEALETSRRALGDEHPDTLMSLNNMGALMRAQGRLNEAEPYLRQALAGRRRALGDEHPLTISSVVNLGVLLRDLGRLDQAEPYYREALETSRRVLGAEHPSTLRALNNMGALLRAQGELGEAEAHWRKALAGFRRALGEDHPETLIALQNLGVLRRQQGELDEAESYHRRALAGRRRVLGDEHPSTIHTISLLGALLKQQGRLVEAEPYYRELLELRRRTLGEEHRDTLDSNRELSELLLAIEERDESP